MNSVSLLISRTPKDKTLDFYINCVKKIKTRLTGKKEPTLKDKMIISIVDELIEKRKIAVFEQA